MEEIIKNKAEINKVKSKKLYKWSMNPKAASLKRKTRYWKLYLDSSRKEKITQINKIRNAKDKQKLTQ